MTNEQREMCKRIAATVGKKLPNGHLAALFRKGGEGEHDELLMAIDMILSSYENANHHESIG